MADLMAQLVGITTDMVSGRVGEEDAVRQAEMLGKRAGGKAIEELASKLAGSVQAAEFQAPRERETTFRLGELGLSAARATDAPYAAATLLAALGTAASAAAEFHRSVAYFTLAADMMQALGRREMADTMRKNASEAASHN